MAYRFGFLLALIMMVPHRASGQIIYLPVQYQYGEQQHFYYGGSDPAVIERALEPRDAGGQWGRVDGYAFASGDDRVHREVVNEPLRVFTDAVPTQNAHLYGYSVADAANEANASVPRYFRKADVIVAAQQTPGPLIVPAQAQPPSAPRSPLATPAFPTTRPSAPAAPTSVRVVPVGLPK